MSEFDENDDGRELRDLPKKIANNALLGVRAKVFEDGRVAVLLFKMVDDKLQKFYLDDEGNWQPVAIGVVSPKLRLVYHEFGGLW